MLRLSKLICLILVISLLAAFTGCAAGTTANSSDATDSYEHRPEIDAEEEKVYEDNDHLFDYKSAEWDGPEGYTIIVPDGNSSAKKSANLLKDYFKDAFSITLAVKTDKTEKGEKEILVGNTNRTDNKALKENELAVELKGANLVFSAGHDVTLDSAVKKFIRLAPEKNQAFTFKLTTDFVSELEGGYKYVWGDEFEGVGLDPNNWELIAKMAGNEVVEVSTDKAVVDVADGRLKMHAISYFDRLKPSVQYRVPCSPVTQNKMNFVYGYAEIRARIPYSQGVWASWWTQGEGSLGGRKVLDNMLEIDIYEIFKTYEKTSYLIQWFPTEFDYNKRYEPKKEPGVSVSVSTEEWKDFENVYKFKASDSLNYEYHIYGFEWTKDEMIMTVDGTVNAKFDLSVPVSKHKDLRIYHDPQFFIFNTHLFYPGISNSDVSIETSPWSLPACHYIDYIRLYQKEDNGSKLYLAK